MPGPVHPGAALQAPSSVVHTSPVLQFAVEVHGNAPPAPPAPAPPPPPAPPAPPPLVPLTPPSPVKSGHDTVQCGFPVESTTQSTIVRPIGHAGSGMAGPQSSPPVPPLPIVPPAALVPPAPPWPAAPPDPPFASGIRGLTEHAAAPINNVNARASQNFGDRMCPRAEH